MHPVFHHIGIVGAGTMGSGIAQVFAQRGYAVSLCDLAAGQLERALNTIDKNLRRDVEKNRINPGQREQTLRNIQTHSDVNALAKSDMIIEAVSENFEVKKKVFASLDDSCALRTILASNTSSISITQLASVTQRPDRVIGMHFMNPVPVMKLVEVIRGVRTSGDTVAAAIDLVGNLDKVAVEVNDSPGFVSNRVLMPMINEAIFCVFEEVGTVDAVDSVMKLGMNHPMGPLTLADLIGLDICLDIMETLYTGFNDSKYRPCPLLKKMVAAGHLGRKSGQGFYQYSQ
ncbi:MAG: 3-hydroxybutyryl-CoA dehydrogenase [Acidobacteria bacterium]|nr:MAG: 3-hydroxybutyryl-CoA dehydrogenase [Acidobacteriota bacterium]